MNESSPIAATFLFTDLVDSTAISSRLDRAAAEDLRQTHFSLLRAAVTSAGGREVKNLGDGLMVVFMSPSRAVACAVAMQQAVERQSQRSPEALAIRIGVAIGEAIGEDNDFFGDPVVEAARLCANAGGGQILTTDLIRLTLGRHAAHEFCELGPRQLKGIPEPVQVVEVLWEPTAGEAASGSMPLPARLVAGGAEGLFAFFGRQDELGRIETAFKTASSGSGLGVVLVAGEPGMGKTTLAAKAARVAHTTGASVAYGYCQEGLAVPYQPWVVALSHIIEHAPDTVLESLRPAHATALASFLPATGRLGAAHGDTAQQRPYGLVRASRRSMDSTLASNRPEGCPGRMSSFITTDRRGARPETVSTQSLMTVMTSSHSPSMLVNMALVSQLSPLARATRTASATRSPTDSPVPSGVIENAAIMDPSFHPGVRSGLPGHGEIAQGRPVAVG